MGSKFAKFTRFAIMLNWTMLLPYYMVGATDALLVTISSPDLKFAFASLIVAAVLIVRCSSVLSCGPREILFKDSFLSKNRHRYNFNHFTVSRKLHSCPTFVSYLRYFSCWVNFPLSVREPRRQEPYPRHQTFWTDTMV